MALTNILHGVTPRIKLLAHKFTNDHMTDYK